MLYLEFVHSCPYSWTVPLTGIDGRIPVVIGMAAKKSYKEPIHEFTRIHECWSQIRAFVAPFVDVDLAGRIPVVIGVAAKKSCLEHRPVRLSDIKAAILWLG